jgi:hypothetical protein
MFKSKLIRLYQTLDDTEVRQFKKWIKSPIHNKHEDVQHLFEYLFSRQGITAITTQRERAFHHLYPKDKLNMPRLRHVMSFATDVLEEFIRYKEYVFDSKYSEIALLRGFRKRNLKKDAQKQGVLTQKILDNQIIQNEDYYWLKYKLEVEDFRLQTEGTRPTSTNLQVVMDSSSLVFVLSTLRYTCITITHQNLYKTQYTIPFLAAILASIEQGDYAAVRSIQLYYACYLALTQPTEDSPYELLKGYLIKYPNILTPHEFREVYEIAINYCIKRLNKGNRYYAEEALDLFMKGIDNKVLLYDGYLSHFAYKNIVAIGLYLGQIDKIKEFIPTGEDLLHPNHRKNYIHYNTAKFHFATKKYDEAKVMLISMEYDDLFMTVDAKMMLLKIYVIQGHFDLMDSFVHSFNQFLRRKKELSYHRNSFLNTVRLTQKVINAFTKEEKKALAEEIERTTPMPIPEKKWLLNQLGIKN